MQLTVLLILASGSPRRQALLRALEIPFEIQRADVNEDPLPFETPEAMVSRLALEKGAAVATKHPNALVLGADTVVVLDGQLLGKPENDQDAIRMLNHLQGQTHTVLTGLSLTHVKSHRAVSCVEKTDVTFDRMSESEIRDYVKTGSPLDKAGSYGIQDDRGALFVRKIEGDFYNVMGLPVNRLYRTLQDEFGDLVVHERSPG